MSRAITAAERRRRQSAHMIRKVLIAAVAVAALSVRACKETRA
jgi:hypothetical protein